MKTLPCKQCSKPPREWFDLEYRQEGYNIENCGLRRYVIYKEEAVEAWNDVNAPCSRCVELEAELTELRKNI